jgi:glycerol-3-phosphate dehydrogenase
MANEISEVQFDVIVIGAGINGAGIARDAAMRGLKVLLLDKGDIGGGTSSWSTRLIHGGLRYLEHGELGLVRESLRERACLMNIAPHLVRPLEILVPIYKHARRGVWTIRAGMIAYDALSFRKTLPRHRLLSRAETLQQAPGLSGEGLLGAAVYFDAQVEFAERLVVENALSAVEHGATVVTYARVDRFIFEAGEVRGVEFSMVQSPMSNVQSHIRTGSGSDRVLASSKVQRPKSKVQDEVSRGEEGGLAPALTTGSHPIVRNVATARVVINAAGPWVDRVLAESAGNATRLIGGTKGSHLIVAPFPGAPDTAIYVEAETDNRPFFIIPWNGNYLIGTTDIRYDGDLDNVPVESDEIDYLLRETNRVIPKAELTRAHILYTYAGVRPLPFTSDKDEQSITRQHFIRAHPRFDNLFSIVGGKLTTYRSLAEQTVDLVCRKLERTWDRGRGGVPGGCFSIRWGARLARNDRGSLKCTTAREPLPGARGSSPTIREGVNIRTGSRSDRVQSSTSNVQSQPDIRTGSRSDRVRVDEGRLLISPRLPEASTDRLSRIYGTRSSLILDLVAEDSSLAEVFDAETGAIAAEVVFAFKHELAQTLSDCLLRRTMVGLNSTCGLDAAQPAAKIAQQHLGWSDTRVDQEIDAYRNEISRRFRGSM